ncbi:MAG: hypothetical protein ACI8X5_001944 [Planctomycetota bacterium]|jgi:hypothetical protein
MTRNNYTRRTLLHGLGVTMALPWMESLSVWGQAAAAKGQSLDAPTRMAVLFSGSGFHKDEWWAKGQGTGMELGKVLTPIESFRDRMVFIRGLFNAEALKGSIHPGNNGNLLSGAPVASGGKIHTGTSVDQVVAQHIGKQTKLPSLVLGCERVNPSVYNNYSMLYSSNISWSSPTSPAPMELYPSLAFDQLFRNSAQRGDKSVLDAVLVDAKDVRGDVSQDDKQKLDEYLNSVREVERRIERAEQSGVQHGWRPTLLEPNMPRPSDGYPEDIVEHMRLMCDLLVLAFQTDTTRVATLKLINDHGSIRFPHLGLGHIIHHLLSHNDTDDWLRMNQFFVEQLAYVARKMEGIQEGDRTLLDNSMLLFCSSIITGNHDATQLPVVMLGGGGGRIQGGQNLDYLEQDDRQMCRLYLSMMDKMGVHLDRFGDATSPLPEV